MKHTNNYFFPMVPYENFSVDDAKSDKMFQGPIAALHLVYDTLPQLLSGHFHKIPNRLPRCASSFGSRSSDLELPPVLLMRLLTDPARVLLKKSWL